jgi:hypothetical protein
MLALILATKNDVPSDFCKSTLIGTPRGVIASCFTHLLSSRPIIRLV